MPDDLSVVELKKGPELGMLEEIIVLARLDKSLDRRPVVTLDRVNAIVKKPRRFYVVQRAILGAPAFTAKGELLGFCVRRMGPEETGNPRVILPAEDIAKIAKQAKEVAAKADEEADEAADEAVEEVDESMEDAGNSMEDAAEEVGDEME